MSPPQGSHTFPASPPKEPGGAASKAELTPDTILALAPSPPVHPSLFRILRLDSIRYFCQVLINTPSYALAPLPALRFGKRHLKLCSSVCPARSPARHIPSVKRHQPTPAERTALAQPPRGVNFFQAPKRRSGRARVLGRGRGAKTPLPAQPESTTLSFPFAKREAERLAEG